MSLNLFEESVPSSEHTQAFNSPIRLHLPPALQLLIGDVSFARGSIALALICVASAITRPLRNTVSLPKLADMLTMGVASSALLYFWVYGPDPIFGVSDVLQWVHATLDNEQKAKLLFLIDSGKMSEAYEFIQG